MKIDKANATLFFDLVKYVLKYADTPGELGKYLTEQIRELIGCRAVALYYFKQLDIKLINVCPERKYNLATDRKTITFLKECHALNSVTVINKDNVTGDLWQSFTKLDVEQSIYIPLVVGENRIGALLIYDLLTDIGNIAVFGALENLSGVIALVLKNALSFQSLEDLVNERTKDLECKNTEYEALNEELQQTNEELLKAKEKAEESDRLKTEFINNMSHEIRTPMNGILGFSKLLNRDNLSKERKTHYISIINNSGNQLMRVIDDILEISRLGTKQVKTIEAQVYLNDLFLELFAVFDIKAKENKTPLYLKRGLPNNGCSVLTDETKLTKILSNLLENALKYTNEGCIEFGYQLQGNEIQIYVKDTGVGIKPEMHEQIFERFWQEEKELTKNVGGLGLGLSIAKENAELMGGKITLQSTKGKGSTFCVTIPYKPLGTGAKSDVLNTDLKPEEVPKYTILVVEDEEVNFLFLETLLEDEIKLNGKILHAKHGHEAVEICTKNQLVDFVLMDLKMPIMNGFEATKLIKEIRPSLPIVAQTAYTSTDDRDKAFLAGCDGFITKPINDKALRAVIDRWLLKSI